MPVLRTDARAARAALRQWREERPGLLAVDTETTGVAWNDRPFCATISYRDARGRIRSGYFELMDDAEEWTPYGREALGEVLRGTPAWVAHNAKFDWQKLLLAGVIERADLDGRELHDTEAQAHLLRPDERKALKLLAQSVLGLSTDEDEKLKRVRRKLGLKKEDGYQWIPRGILAPYAIKDTEFTLQLHEHLYPQLDGRLLDLYRDEMELSIVLLDMEAAGFGLDVEYLRDAAQAYSVRIMGHLATIRAHGGELLNPASPKQLLEAFADNGFQLESTDEATLSKIADESPLARAVLDFRKDKKLHTTYLVGLLNEQRDGVIHPGFRQHGARTGRMSSATGG